MDKYFIYTYIWKRSLGEHSSYAMGYGGFKNIIMLYEFVAKQPEYWALTHVAEITKEEYNMVKERGHIG